MPYELVASGEVWELGNLGSYESLLPEGDRALLELDLRLPVSQSVADELENALRQAGVADVNVVTASPKLRIHFRKGFPWLAVIAAIILGLIVIAILIIGWRLFKEVVPPEWQPAIGTLALLVLIGLGIMLLTRRRR